jgi:hypothetical protein
MSMEQGRLVPAFVREKCDNIYGKNTAQGQHNSGSGNAAARQPVLLSLQVDKGILHIQIFFPVSKDILCLKIILQIECIRNFAKKTKKFGRSHLPNFGKKKKGLTIWSVGTVRKKKNC